MLTLSATCVAIAIAAKAGTLTLTEKVNPRLEAMGLDGRHVVIADDHGVIEIATDMAEAEARVAAIMERAA